jgi:hypothetical protein
MTLNQQAGCEQAPREDHDMISGSLRTPENHGIERSHHPRVKYIKIVLDATAERRYGWNRLWAGVRCSGNSRHGTGHDAGLNQTT